MNLFLVEPSVGHAISIPLSASTSLPVYSPADSQSVGEWIESGAWGRIVASFYESKAENLAINDLEAGYTVLAPIPVTIELVEDATYLARFDEANIAITGTDKQDAYQSLVAEVLDTFDMLATEANLAPAAAAQLAVLRAYIAKP